jgi:hypothetical protein
MRLHVEADNGCPVCNSTITLTEVEPQPNRDGWEIRGFSCQFCGPVKSLVVLSPAEEEPALVRMMMLFCTGRVSSHIEAYSKTAPKLSSAVLNSRYIVFQR